MSQVRAGDDCFSKLEVEEKPSKGRHHTGLGQKEKKPAA